MIFGFASPWPGAQPEAIKQVYLAEELDSDTSLLQITL